MITKQERRDQASAPGAFDQAVDRIVGAIADIKLPAVDLRLTIEEVTTSIGKASTETEAILAKKCQVFKTEEERFVLGIVLEPTKEMNQPDSQGDIYSAESVRKSAYLFMEEYQTIGLQHREDITGRVKILLNWITMEDTTINGQPVVKGTWLLGVRVLDDALWADVKNGNITGFSIGGVANRQPIT